MCWENRIVVACPSCNDTTPGGTRYEKCPKVQKDGKAFEGGYKRRTYNKTGEDCAKCVKIEELKNAAAVKLTEDLRAMGYDA
ncbi:unnamed protein product [Fusarium equiseti]|uniref:Uncharacterized protein n=1 Tax=Fusarium equiseti TaxID=61235 RepID=A0A8J2IMC6_FUSEQ|nr:unnamed protein product [Fusarium equiseti]